MFHFDKDVGLFVGRLHKNEYHRHYAVQICVSMKSKMNLHLEDGGIKQGNGFYIPSKVKHKLLSEDPQLTILINPLSPLGHQLHLLYQSENDFSLNPKVEIQLKSLLNRLCEERIEFNEFCSHIKVVLNEYRCACAEQIHAGDPRIIRILNLFDKNAETIYSVEEASEICCLSPSRFLHLFKEKTGFTFRRYQLWNKVVKSLPQLSCKSITEVAHSCGFTDSSHYTRTMKETFGITPSFFIFKE